MRFLKRLFCKHGYKTITNIGGDAINLFRGARSLKECIYCRKRKFDDYLDYNCKKVNQL